MLIGFYGIITLVFLLLFRIPVAIALMVVSIGGVAYLFSWDSAVGMLASIPMDFLSTWSLSAIPMFLLMGFICFHSGITEGLFNAAKVICRRLPGGLAISSIFASSGFAAVSGSSVACAAAMGKIAIPEMVRGGYSPGFACGTIAAGGTIGALIPPSILLIVYGVFAQVSITDLFLGGVAVGLLTAISYSITVLVVSYFRPDIVPRAAEIVVMSSASRAVLDIWPVLVLGVIVFGGLFSGLFTATEAGAVGAVGSILISSIMRKLSIKQFCSAIVETLATTATILIIGVAASMFTLFLSLSGVSSEISGLISSWEPSYLQLIILVVFIYLVLGLFMEPFGAMLMTLPILFPVFETYDVSLVWFGVLLVKLLEIGMITPPVGMNIFVISGVAKDYATLGDIFKGVSTYLLADVAVVALIIAFPSVVFLFLGSQ